MAISGLKFIRCRLMSRSQRPSPSFGTREDEKGSTAMVVIFRVIRLFHLNIFNFQV